MFEQAVYALLMLWSTGEISRNPHPMTSTQCVQVVDALKAVRGLPIKTDDGHQGIVLGAKCVFEVGA